MLYFLVFCAVDIVFLKTEKSNKCYWNHDSNNNNNSSSSSTSTSTSTSKSNSNNNNMHYEIMSFLQHV